MVALVFERGLHPTYVIDTHPDHISGARNLKSKTIARLVMHEKAPSSVVDIRVEDGDRLHLEALPLKFLHITGHAKGLASIRCRDFRIRGRCDQHWGRHQSLVERLYSWRSAS